MGGKWQGKWKDNECVEESNRWCGGKMWRWRVTRRGTNNAEESMEVWREKYAGEQGGGKRKCGGKWRRVGEICKE